MKTDRELTELAARAAGIKVLRDPNGQLRNCKMADPCVNIFALPLWMPLTDDGDALRLAVKLDVDITRYGNRVGCTFRMPVYGTPADYDTLQEELGDDPYAATRRAIVRAAAAIGEAM